MAAVRSMAPLSSGVRLPGMRAGLPASGLMRCEAMATSRWRRSAGSGGLAGLDHGRAPAGALRARGHGSRANDPKIIFQFERRDSR